ncbi:MAG: protein translocase SEC61 complex subunit gamma [Candidatus Altiarchaeia archaeon]
MALNLKEIPAKVDYAIKETRRILRLTRKPRGTEFNETAKITGLGMVFIGALGFILFIVFQLLPI